MSYFGAIPASLESNDAILKDIKISFIIAFILFFALLPLYTSRKSYWDIISARKTIKYIRFFILLEAIVIAIVLYFCITHNSPIYLGQLLSYGNSNYNNSWLYGFGRPTFAIVTIGMGLLCEAHPAMRLVCLLGCLGEVFSAALAAFQIGNYIFQITKNSSPLIHGYTVHQLRVYYYASIISIAFCTYLFMLCSLLCCIIGFSFSFFYILLL
jgi:hypothetical protein